MTQIKVNSANTTHGNIAFEQPNPVISDFIQQSREQLDYKYIVQIIPDYTSSAIKDDWRANLIDINT